MFSNSCSRRHIYREDNFRCSASVSYLYRIKSLWHIYRWRTFSEISVWCFLSSISQFALMIVMETKFTTFAVFRANEGETSPLGMESPLAVRSLRGGGFPLKPKSQGIQKETCYHRKYPLLCRKDAVTGYRIEEADVKCSGHRRGHMVQNCSIFSVYVQSEPWSAKKFGAQKLTNLAFLEARTPCLPPLRAFGRSWGLRLKEEPTCGRCPGHE